MLNKVSVFNFSHFLCIFEHDPIYTVGLRGHLYSQEEEDRLRSLGADFVRSKRGGMITFHGPGQMVVYPMMDLKHLKLRMEGNNGSSFMGVKKFVSSIEEVLIQLLNDDLGIQRVGRTEDTGTHLRQSFSLSVSILQGFGWIHIAKLLLSVFKFVTVSPLMGLHSTVTPICDGLITLFLVALRERNQHPYPVNYLRMSPFLL